MLFSDGNVMTKPLLKILTTAFKVASAAYSSAESMESPGGRAVVFCLGKLQPKELDLVRAVSNRYSAPPIFVFPTFNSGNVERVESIPGARHFISPLEDAPIRKAVRTAINQGVEASWGLLPPAEELALKSSLQSFEAIFGASTRGEPLPVAKVYDACENIQCTLGVSNVDRWLGSLRQHHNSTYRHSMFVCGALAYFAHEVGVRGDDLKQLTVGGFLHDAGKAMVPLEVLDKAGKLDDAEWEMMRRHPEYSREILSKETGLAPETVAMAVHHHEKLDGTGYPDNLKGKQINDYVRLTSIADVYAALAEERAYKAAMPTEEALNLMCSFKGHLDLSLTRRFREFILDSVDSSIAA